MSENFLDSLNLLVFLDGWDGSLMLIICDFWETCLIFCRAWRRCAINWSRPPGHFPC